MSKINKVNFDGAYLRSSSGHFLQNNTFLELKDFIFCDYLYLIYLIDLTKCLFVNGKRPLLQLGVKEVDIVWF